MDIKQLADKSIGQLKSAAEELGRLKGFSLRSLAGLVRITKTVVKHVEEVGLAEGIRGADKQALAVELISRLVPVPWPLSILVKPLLPVIVDAVVDALKDRFGA